MTEVEPPAMSLPFGDLDSGAAPLSLEATLCRDDARESMRRTSSTGDIPRSWKGNIEVAAADFLSIRRGSATSNGTANTDFSSKDTDVSDVVSQLSPWRSLIPSAKVPQPASESDTFYAGAAGTHPHERMRLPRQYSAASPIPSTSATVVAASSPSHAGPPPLVHMNPGSSLSFASQVSMGSATPGTSIRDATQSAADVAVQGPNPSTKAKKPLRSVLRRPSSPTAYNGLDGLTPSPMLRSEPALHLNGSFRIDESDPLYYEHRRTTGRDIADSGSENDADTPGLLLRHARKNSAPDAVPSQRRRGSFDVSPRPKSAGSQKIGPNDPSGEFEQRVSFSVDTGGNSSDDNSNFSEGQRKAFSAFMGQTRKHAGDRNRSATLTAEEIRGMRIFLDQCQRRRGGAKAPGPPTTLSLSGTATTGSDDEPPAPRALPSSSSPGTIGRDRRSHPRVEGERSEILESYSSLARKRARSNNTYTTTKQTHISNMSIFKARPDEADAANELSVTIVAEHPMIPRRSSSNRDDEDEYSNGGPSIIENSSDEVDDMPGNSQLRKASGSSRVGPSARKLYLTPEGGAEIAAIGSVGTVAAGSTWRPGRIRASFTNSSQGSRRSSDPQIRSPWMKAVRLPPRWLSLRNAMAVTNVIIITLAIMIITIVSYVSSKDTAATALDTLGIIALKSIALSVGTILSRAEDKNGDTATAVIVYGLRPDTIQCPAFFWSNARRDTAWGGDQSYLVDRKGSFCGFLSQQTPRFQSFEEEGIDDPTSRDGLFTLRLANGTAPAPRYSYSMNSTMARECPDLGVPDCVTALVAGPADGTDIYDATQRQYYKQAVEQTMGSWTGAYNLGSGDGYGFTNVLPIRASIGSQASPLLAVAAVDIHLGSLSLFLGQSLSALLHVLDTSSSNIQQDKLDVSADSIQFLIADLKTDSIIASTCPGLTGTNQQNPGEPAPPESPPRPYSSLTSDPCFGNLAAAIGPLSNLPHEAALDDGNVRVLSVPLRVWSESTLTVASRFSPREGLQWAIVGRVPGHYFNIKLGDIYTLTIPLTAALVLVASGLGSFLITRAIGRPLKRAAEKMMRIADLNFDEDVIDTEAESDVESDHEGPSIGARRWSFASFKLRWISGSLDDGRNQSSETAVRRSFFLPPRSVSHAEPKHRRRSSAPRKRKTPPFVLKEIQLLNTAMDAMTSGLKSFSKYVPLDVVALLVKMKREAVLGVDEMSLSIFFSDIANFTTIAESMSPQQLVLVMSEYLSEMSSIILESQGIVDKFIGDAVMAFWNAPLYLDEHAIVACDAALKSQERLRQMRADWLEKGFPEIRARIGLNTGPALVGNLGSPTRLNYTCLGDTVNLASRLEELNKRYHTSIIVSDAVRDQVHEYFVLRPLDYVAVKGKTVAKKCFELVDSVEECDPAVSRRMLLYEKAFDYYCQGEFEQAKQLFETYLIDVPWDVPATMHLEECMRLEEEGVPGNWSPVVVLDEK